MTKITLALVVSCSLMAFSAIAAPKAAAKKSSAKPAAAAPAATPEPAQHHEAAAPEHKKTLEEQVSGQGYGMAGCGLGSIVFGDKPGMIQIIAATLNGTVASQTFGITSGTSNCAEGSQHANASLFIEVNRQALKRDASRGNGETIANLSEIYGCSNSLQLGRALQQNFEVIFNDDAATSEKVNDSIESTIKNDGALSQSCAG